MTDPGRPISEDELHAYVDGLLDPGRRLEVEHYLEAHPAVAQRVGAYRTEREDLGRLSPIGTPNRFRPR